jgi:hypothetical protein
MDEVYWLMLEPSTRKRLLERGYSEAGADLGGRLVGPAPISMPKTGDVTIPESNTGTEFTNVAESLGRVAGKIEVEAVQPTPPERDATPRKEIVLGQWSAPKAKAGAKPKPKPKKATAGTLPGQAEPAPSSKVQGPCVNCGRIREIKGHGMCGECHKRWYE